MSDAPRPHWKAIAAMAENRVIGNGPKIPWHLPEDFKWFKQTTLGHIIVMGRKTYESIGRPLPRRHNVVITRNALDIENVSVVNSLDDAEHLRTSEQSLFLCGGAEVYRLGLTRCSDLYLTHVHQSPNGDILFPEFEHLFLKHETLKETEAFTIVHYKNKHTAS